MTLAAFLLVVISTPAQSQSPAACDNGLIEFPGGASGRLTLCRSVAAQAPDLERRLEAIRKNFEGQQQQLTQLTRLIRGLNSVGQNLESRQQSELLRNLLSQMQANQQVGPDQTERLMTMLAEGFERLQDQLLAGLTNRASSERVLAALSGPVGDSISQLDLPNAESQLSQIRSQLQTIGNQVAEANQRTANIQATLGEQQLELPRVVSAAASVDLRALRALSAAGLQPSVLEEALRVADGAGKTTALRFFEGSVESVEAAQWLDSMLAAGLDPNTTVPSTTYGREALLSVAMEAGNAPAMRALLERGASPHPYQTIVATTRIAPRFLFPLNYLSRDDRLSLTDKQSLIRAFLEAGAVVPAIPPEANKSHVGGEVSEVASEVPENLRDRIGMKAAPLAAWGNLDRICRRAAPRTGDEWCAAMAAIPKKLTFQASQQSWHWYDIELQYPLFVSRTRAYFLATSGDYALAEISKDGSTWTLYRYGGDSAGEGGCKSAGSDTTDFCWKTFTIHSVPKTNQMKQDGRGAIWTFETAAPPRKQ